ncbi:hypothetical protein [Streptomyces sp. NPDC046821]|uniref:hypothetical protein n=1 Tax=Streptomyces sp. NPDC046821 TaxID=3154702 RepID=UPI0033D93535
MTLHAFPHPGRQVLGALVPAPSSERDVLGTVLGAIWALGSLIAVCGLGYVVQHNVEHGADAQATAAAADTPPSAL